MLALLPLAEITPAEEVAAAIAFTLVAGLALGAISWLFSVFKGW